MTAPTRSNGYLIAPDQDATREFFQTLFSDIHDRLMAMELTKADYEDAVNLITTQALASVSATLGQEIADQRNVLAEIQTNAEAVLRAYEEISLSGVPARTIRVEGIAGLDAANVQAALSAIWLRKISTELLEDKAVTFAKQAHVSTARLIGRRTAGEGPQEALTAAQVKEVLGKFGNADLADMPAGTFKGRKSTADGAPEDLTAGDLEKLLAPLRAGELVWLPGGAIPTGRRILKLNGAATSRAAYTELWAYAQVSGILAASEAAKTPAQFGPGDGATTFTLPDWRGYLPRAWDEGRGIDPGRAIASLQDDAFQQFTGGITFHGSGSATILAGAYGAFQLGTARGEYRAAGANVAGVNSYDGVGLNPAAAARTAAETRPKNIAALFGIRF